MIEIKDVSFQYEGNDAGRLEKINLRVREGECVLLCGRSGCGKTTILRLINGLIPEYFNGGLSGEVLYNGKEMSTMPMYERSEYIGSVFQNPRTQFFNVDTDSEIVFGMENLGVARDEMYQRMADATEKFHLKDLRKRSIFELSGGEKQKIAFASIYAMMPDIFLLDEPSSNLDARSVEELGEQLKLVKQQGKTIIISEHRLYYLMDLVDRIIYLDNGKIVSEYSKAEFLSISDDKRAAMGLRETGSSAISPKGNLKEAVSRNTFELRNVTISRGKRIIQKDLILSAGTGEIIGVIGENGAGKSTLLRTLCGLHKDFTGAIIVDGCEIKRKKLRELSYMVMQDVNYELFADSVEKECSLGLKYTDSGKITQTLELLSLNGVRTRHPNTLSGGQKQRLAVAVSRICEKKILIFDEPTSGLDYDSMKQVAELIRELAQDTIVFIVTHDIEFINLACTRVIELKKESN